MTMPHQQPASPPLAGVKVLELARILAGPWAGQIFADLGAEVIKVERPGGDDARQWGPPFLDGESLWYSSVNRNKKSVVLDLEQPADFATLKDLIGHADVVVTNQTLRVQRKLGLDYEAVRKIRSDIVFTAITGFGLEGERADMPCYDLIAEGYSGIMDVTGAADSPPQKIGAPAADMLSGQDAAMATIAALLDRRSSGRGHLVDVALVDSMTRMLTARITSYLGSGECPVRTGGTDSVIAIYQAFDTADAPLTIGIGTNGIWRRFCTAVGMENYLEHSNLATNAQRRGERPALVREIQRHLLTRRRDEWLEIFRRERVPAGPINRVDELTQDAALRARGLFFTLDDGVRHVPQVGLGISVDGRFSVPRSAPPACGEHTEEIREWLRQKRDAKASATPQ